MATLEQARAFMRKQGTAPRNGVKAAPMPPTLEKDHEHRGDQLMAEYGFTVIRFSQARASMQTEGIPDRRYYSPTRGLVFWWEAKREDGKQSRAQRDFQLLCEATGDVYVCGTFADLSAWFARQVTLGWPAWRIVLEGALGRLDDEGVGRERV